VALAALAIPASAAAKRPANETISISWAVTSPPPTSPLVSRHGWRNVHRNRGDHGLRHARGRGPGRRRSVPEPCGHQLKFTLTGSTGTLNLRCKQTETDFSDPTALPSTGPCTITGGGAGVYADVQGHGTMNGVIDGLT
jgi:hypothetical protein